jgi:riboflavin transporter FmnP
MFIALGVILPLAFHLVRVGGAVILPMHIPVILGGFFAGPLVGVLVGVITPVISYLLTGMPPLAPLPVLITMVFELGTYGAVTGLLYRYTKQILLSLIGAMIAGRIILGITVWVLLHIFGFTRLPGAVLFVKGAVVTGLPGVVLQVAFIPVILTRFKTVLPNLHKGV